jgi:glucuronosyltransferase
MNRITLLSALLFFYADLASCGKILILTFYASKSNQITYLPLIEELASRGHQITVISPIPSTKSVPNITHILTFDVISDPIMQQFNGFEMKRRNLNTNPFTKVEFFTPICERTYNLPHIKEFIRNLPHFDLIFMQSTFNECALGLAYKLKAPLVLFSPTVVPHFQVTKMGAYYPPSFVPSILTKFRPEMSFLERIWNFWIEASLQFNMKFVLETAMEKLYREQLEDPTIPSISEIYANASLIFSNGHFSIHGGRPNLPNIVDIGGIHSRPAKPLSKVFCLTMRFDLNLIQSTTDFSFCTGFGRFYCKRW